MGTEKGGEDGLPKRLEMWLTSIRGHASDKKGGYYVNAGEEERRGTN